MSHQPIIHVLSYTQITTSEYPVMMPVYNVDREGGPLEVGIELIDQRQLIVNREYERSLRHKIEKKDPATLVALDNIYNQSTNGGVILATLVQCVPFRTHAHVVRDIILELAEGK